jgi:hypothetical protein
MSGTSLKRTLSEVALYPEHAPRKPTALYLKSHHHLVVEMDLPCLICGVRNSTLKDATHNPRGAKAMETHHRVIEDSLANAVDVAKFNALVLPGLYKHYQEDRYKIAFTQEQMIEWIHGDEGNLWVLCDVCHRHPLVGIHAITGPIWGVQNLLIDGYDLTGYHAYTPVEAAQLTALPMTTGKAEVAK